MWTHRRTACRAPPSITAGAADLLCRRVRHAALAEAIDAGQIRPPRHGRVHARCWAARRSCADTANQTARSTCHPSLLPSCPRQLHTHRRALAGTAHAALPRVHRPFRDAESTLAPIIASAGVPRSRVAKDGGERGRNLCRAGAGAGQRTCCPPRRAGSCEGPKLGHLRVPGARVNEVPRTMDSAALQLAAGQESPQPDLSRDARRSTLICPLIDASSVCPLSCPWPRSPFAPHSSLRAPRRRPIGGPRTSTRCSRDRAGALARAALSD